MKQRDQWKQAAKNLALISNIACPAQIQAWAQYKNFQNTINNRKKVEERNYKSNKMAEVADNPELVWKSAKAFMGWKSTGIPTQLKVGGVLFTSAKKIAELMNEFFLNKVQTIRAGSTWTMFTTL